MYMLWKQFLSFIRYGGINILTKLETVQFRCKRVLIVLDERIAAMDKNATEIKTGINICEADMKEYSRVIQRLNVAFLKAHELNNVEDLNTINNEITIHEQMLADITLSHDNSVKHYDIAIEELNIVRRERDVIEGKLRLAASRHAIAVREQKYLTNGSNYTSIEQEVKDITKIVNDTEARTKAIRQVQQDTIPATKMIEAKYGSATMSIQDRLNQLQQANIIAITQE